MTELVVYGIVLGSIIALGAIGLTLLYGILRFAHFAHGDLMTLGAYDLVLIYEAPDDAVSARFQLLLGAQGNVRTTTMKAFPEAAYREVIASLG